VNDHAGTGGGLTEEARRRRRARVFGDVLPDSTGDELDDRSDDRSDDGSGHEGSGTDEWLRQQVPPHHG
jgi:hypothetical protein